jgi:hypothetical protein
VQPPALAPNAAVPNLAQAAPARLNKTTPSKAAVGDEVRVSVDGLTPSRPAELVWESVQGGWAIEDGYFFRGRKYAETRQTLANAAIDEQGRLEASIRLPEDYGGVHNLLTVVDGVAVARGAIDLTQSFQISPSEGPIGTLVQIRATGLGWRTMENTWVVNWDNREVGWVSAADTRGTATARFRASGPIGDHEIKVYCG